MTVAQTVIVVLVVLLSVALVKLAIRKWIPEWFDKQSVRGGFCRECAGKATHLFCNPKDGLPVAGLCDEHLLKTVGADVRDEKPDDRILVTSKYHWMIKRGTLVKL